MSARRGPARTLALALVAASLLCSFAAGADNNERALKKLQALIGEINKDIAKDVARRDSLLGELASSEKLVQAVNKKIAAIKVERANAQSHLNALNDQRREREGRLQREKAGLAAQLRAAFISGRQEQLMLLLNQQDPAAVGRLSVYYRYLSEQRTNRLEAVLARLAQLRSTMRAVEQQKKALTGLVAQHNDERKTLEAARKERLVLVQRIAKRIEERGTQAAQLEREESRLLDLIKELERILKEFPVDSQEPFATLKGTLAWPIKGRLLADFGQPRAGRKIKWNGVLLAADRGAPVRAIARGRVAFADWLPGLGLLVVVEHSDGYISLYGHNETLRAQAGDWVRAGDTLATVGDSGGQSRPALYFEIRFGKQPVNPHRWFSTRVSQ